jgi:hypothetical protein
MEGTSARNDVYEELKQYSSRPKRDVPVKPISRNARYEHFIRTGTTPESRVTREFNDVSVKYAHNKNIFDLMRHSTRPPNIPDLPIPDPMVMFEIQKNNKDIRKQKTTSNITDFLLKFAASVLQYDDYNDRSVPMDKRTQDMLFQNNFKKAIGSKDIIDILKRSENNFNQYSDLFIRLSSAFSPQILGREVSNAIKKQPISDNLNSWLNQVFSSSMPQAQRTSERKPFVPRYGTSTMYEVPAEEEEEEEEKEEKEEEKSTATSSMLPPKPINLGELVSQQQFMSDGSVISGINIPDSIYQYLKEFKNTNNSELQGITEKIDNESADYDDTIMFDQLQMTNNIIDNIASEYQAGRSPLGMLHRMITKISEDYRRLQTGPQNIGSIKNADTLEGVMRYMEQLIKDIGDIERNMSPPVDPSNIITYVKHDEEEEEESQLSDPMLNTSILSQPSGEPSQYTESELEEFGAEIKQLPPIVEIEQSPFSLQIIYDLLLPTQEPTDTSNVPPDVNEYLNKYKKMIRDKYVDTDIITVTKKNIIINLINNIIGMYNKNANIVKSLDYITKTMNDNVREMRREKLTPETSLDMKLLMTLNSDILSLRTFIYKYEEDVKNEQRIIAEGLKRKEQEEKKIMQLINPVAVQKEMSTASSSADIPLPEMAPASSSIVSAPSLTTEAPIRSYVKEYPEESVYEPEIVISNSAVRNAAKEMELSDKQSSAILANLYKSGLAIKGTKREDIPGSVADWLSNISDPTFTIGDIELEFVSNILFNSIKNISDIENVPEQKKEYGKMRGESLTGLLRNFTVLAIYWTIQSMRAGDNIEAAKEFAENARKFQMERQKILYDNEARTKLTTSQIARYNAFFEKGYGKRKPTTRRRRY